MPATRKRFWSAKLCNNAERDYRNVRALRKLGWGVLVVWECQLVPSRIQNLIEKATAFLT